MRVPHDPARGGDVHAWARQVNACLRSLIPQAGPDILPDRTTGGTRYRIKARAGGGAAETITHPFQVFQRPKPDVEGVFQYGVRYESSLYKSLKPNDKQAITGLLDEDMGTGWFDLSPGGYIWLGIIFDEFGEIEDALIDNSETEAFDITQHAWSGENGYCEDDEDEENPVHQTSRKLIAYTISGESGAPVLYQVMFRDQVLRNVNIDGRPARYPFDHEGGYPL